MTEDQFKARYPQFATNTNIATYLTEALLFVGEGFGSRAEMAVGLYVAHYCAVEAEERARATSAPSATYAGDIVSKGAGKLSISRSGEAVAAKLKDPMMATTYGQRFVYLRKLAGVGAMASGAHWMNDSGTGLCDPDDIIAPGEGEDLL